MGTSVKMCNMLIYICVCVSDQKIEENGLCVREPMLCECMCEIMCVCVKSEEYQNNCCIQFVFIQEEI